MSNRNEVGPLANMDAEALLGMTDKSLAYQSDFWIDDSAEILHMTTTKLVRKHTTIK